MMSTEAAGTLPAPNAHADHRPRLSYETVASPEQVPLYALVPVRGPTHDVLPA
jgi:hypothetical protein